MQVYLWGFLLRKKSLHVGLCASVLALAVWKGSIFYNYTIQSFFVLFPSNPFGVDAGMMCCFGVLKLASSLLICSTSTCPEPRLVVQVFAQALLPCQLLLAFVKRNAHCTTRRCTSMCAASQCTCLAVPAALSRKVQSAYAFK